MLVMKFGGTSVADAAAIALVVAIVAAAPESRLVAAACAGAGLDPRWTGPPPAAPRPPWGAAGPTTRPRSHAAKRDAPSGTALALERAMHRGGYARPIHVSSTRAGSIPGTHTVGFDGPAETVTLTHTTRDRSTFARGALEAARWMRGRHGWFTMREVLGL